MVKKIPIEGMGAWPTEEVIGSSGKKTDLDEVLLQELASKSAEALLAEKEKRLEALIKLLNKYGLSGEVLTLSECQKNPEILNSPGVQYRAKCLIENEMRASYINNHSYDKVLVQQVIDLCSLTPEIVQEIGMQTLRDSLNLGDPFDLDVHNKKSSGETMVDVKKIIDLYELPQEALETFFSQVFYWVGDNETKFGDLSVEDAQKVVVLLQIRPEIAKNVGKESLSSALHYHRFDSAQKMIDILQIEPAVVVEVGKELLLDKVKSVNEHKNEKHDLTERIIKENSVEYIKGIINFCKVPQDFLRSIGLTVDGDYVN
ncbi:MAG: hypothetical protein US42_C0008G0013 [Candidatus Magasanikbacteria bacterium GW2011_GWC2_37_14]|uniref:Uncharacterized protein n=1 Tax=Candidatus Magasanikbacteria bacterium GW2011_GWC2_37_14 TaxID=1619046 RepID=A0A0G0GBZ7_9BACT|nr:MAG: hypothetical protein US42_C0008G0013 [Candidatus Magasanikbacteria bacterium GW2011_GWC2_37_14]